MAFNLAQIINTFVPIQTIGSTNYKSYQLSVNQSTNYISFGQDMQNLLISNDGSNDVKFALQGKYPLSVVYDNTDPKWSYIGTWSSDTTATIHATGADVSKTTTTGSMAVFSPNVACNQIGASLSNGTSAGIAKLELSSDGGNTWASPSTISGVTRSDGATGTSMDTYDEYSNSYTGVTDVIFTMPTSSVWSLRVSYTGTKNSSSPVYTIYIDAGKIGGASDTNTIIVKAGEAISLQIKSGDIRLITESGTQSVRLVVSG